jgi:hypothetical protein
MIGHLFYNPPSFSTPGGWIVVGATVWFSIWAIFCLFAIRNNWSVEQTDRIFDQITRPVGYVLFVPLALIVVVLAGIVLFPAFGWLATIPSWAAVIIVLLVLIYLRLK